MTRFALTLTAVAALAAAACGARAQTALETVARGPAEPVLIEAAAIDGEGRLLVSSVHLGGVHRLGADGEMDRLTPADAGRGVFGLVADPERGWLWAASTDSAFDTAEGGGAALLKLDLATGRLLGRYEAGDGDHAFGDLALGPDGAVYISDSVAREVLRLSPGGSGLETVATFPERGSPQGLAIWPEGGWLIVADYPTGLHRITLATGERAQVAGPEGVELRGLDGLVLAPDGRVIAIQNGTATPRVLALTMSPDWTSVLAVERLVEGEPLSEPTTGLIHDGALVFVSRSQWTDFGPEGQPRTPTPEPAVISRLRLEEPRP